jgi:hypothetical protein
VPGTPPAGPGPAGGARQPARDADRERLIVLLREHYARGQLELEELSRRVGIVLAATYVDEAAGALTGLPQFTGQISGTAHSAPSGQPRPKRRRGHAQAAKPGAGWVPTDERFRDPTTRVVMRVWIDPADLSRHYVPDGED